MAQQCPNCHLFNPDTAERCDCGYDFLTKKVEQSYLSPKTLSPTEVKRARLHQSLGRVVGIGLGLLVVSVIVSVVNAGLGQYPRIVGLGVTAAGFLLYLVYRAVSRTLPARRRQVSALIAERWPAIRAWCLREGRLLPFYVAALLVSLAALRYILSD